MRLGVAKLVGVRPTLRPEREEKAAAADLLEETLVEVANRPEESLKEDKQGVARMVATMDGILKKRGERTGEMSVFKFGEGCLC